MHLIVNATSNGASASDPMNNQIIRRMSCHATRTLKPPILPERHMAKKLIERPGISARDTMVTGNSRVSAASCSGGSFLECILISGCGEAGMYHDPGHPRHCLSTLNQPGDILGAIQSILYPHSIALISLIPYIA